MAGLGQIVEELGREVFGSACLEMLFGGCLAVGQAFAGGGDGQRFVEGLGKWLVGVFRRGSWVGRSAVGGWVLEVEEEGRWVVGGVALSLENANWVLLQVGSFPLSRSTR